MASRTSARVLAGPCAARLSAARAASIPAPARGDAAASTRWCRRMKRARSRTARMARRWSSPSCNPPVQASDFLTTGTPDANGFPSRHERSLAPRRHGRQPHDARRTRPTSASGSRSPTCVTAAIRRSTFRTSSTRGSRCSSPTRTTGAAGSRRRCADDVSAQRRGARAQKRRIRPWAARAPSPRPPTHSSPAWSVRASAGSGRCASPSACSTPARMQTGSTPRSSSPRGCSSRRAQLMKSAASQGLPGAITSRKRSSSSGSIEYVCSAAGKLRSRTSSA